jgi:hypothetical protein
VTLSVQALKSSHGLLFGMAKQPFAEPESQKSSVHGLRSPNARHAADTRRCCSARRPCERRRLARIRIVVGGEAPGGESHVSSA